MFANRDAGGSGQHDIDHGDLLQFGEDLARLVAKAGTLAPETQNFPENIGKKADEDMGLYAMFLYYRSRKEAEAQSSSSVIRQALFVS